jgi:hypothetical protein
MPTKNELSTEEKTVEPESETKMIRAQLEQALTGESNSLDIDKIFERLSDIELELNASGVAQDEANTLRDDLISRIQHMGRAIVVVAPDRLDREVDSWPETLSAKDLIQRYRKLCVIFRDTFGGSLRYLPQAASRSNVEDYSDYRG